MHRNTSTQRLVGDKGLQLGEAPRMECCALRPTSLDPRADVRQIFDGDPTLRAFGRRNNPLGDTVVDMFGESGFLPSKQTQTAAAALGQRARARGQSGRAGIGMLAAISDFQIHSRAPAGKQLQIEVRELRRLGPMLLVAGTVSCEGQQIASGELMLYA